MNTRFKRQAAAMLFLVLLLLAPLVHGQETLAREYQLKAAFLLKFKNYVEWDESSGKGANLAQNTLCIVGEDPFGSDLDKIAALQNKTAEFSINILRENNAHECNTSQIVFISRSKQNVLHSELAELAAFQTLTVSDIPGFAQEGGMIELLTIEDRISFIINLAAGNLSGIKFNAKLLGLAWKVLEH